MAGTPILKSNFIEILCRTCLKLEKDRCNIFESSQNNKLISELLMECTSVKVQVDDGFPASICNDCLEKLNSVLDFREMVLLSSIKLQNFCTRFIENGKDIEGSKLNDIVLKELVSLKKESNDLSSDFVNNPVYKCVAEICQTEKENRLNNNQENANDKFIADNISNDVCNPDRKQIDSINCQSIEIEQPQSKCSRRNTVKRTVKKKIPPQYDSADDSFDEPPCSNNYSSDSECEDVNNSTKQLALVEVEKKDKNTFNYIKYKDENDSAKQLVLDGDEKRDKNTFNWIDKHVDILDNPDCKRIISMGLSKKEKDRATVFCKICGKTVNFRYYVQVHAQTHVGNIPFKCDKCNKSFAQKHILNQHIRAVHEKTIKLSCDVCGKGFTSLSIMLQHKTKHSDVKPYECETCGKAFKLSSTLKKHYVVHKNDKQFTCELCGKSFLEKNNLREHILSHTTEKNFSCTICPKAFTTKRGLDSHLKRHTGNRPYICSYCGKGFTVGSVLKKHILIHTGAKPYTCKICERKFTQDSSLRYHMRIHTGERPYSCDSCCISFRYKHLLKNHMNRLHKDSGPEEESKI